MKKRQHILPCGRVVFFKEYSPKDITSKKSIQKVLFDNKQELRKFVSIYDHPVKAAWVKAVYNKFATLLVKKLADHLMESDRIEMMDGKMWMIAGVENNNPKFVNWHTDGMTYATTIKGRPHTFRITFSQRRRKELENRIKGGQQFHTIWTT